MKNGFLLFPTHLSFQKLIKRPLACLHYF